MHELMDCSVGVDGGATNAQLLDGRGFYRQGASDIGAFERSATPNLDHDLVGHFEFEEGTGTVIGDSSVTGNDGAINIQASNWSSDAAAGSHVLDFGADSGLNSYADIPDNAAYDFVTGEYAIALWYKMSTPIETVNLLGNQQGGNAGFAIMADPSGQLRLIRHDGANSAITYSDVLSFDGTWHHLTASVDSSGNVKLYVDGVDRTSLSLTALQRFNPRARPTTSSGRGGAIRRPATMRPPRCFSLYIDGQLVAQRATTITLDYGLGQSTYFGSHSAIADISSAGRSPDLALPNRIVVGFPPWSATAPLRAGNGELGAPLLRYAYAPSQCFRPAKDPDIGLRVRVSTRIWHLSSS